MMRPLIEADFPLFAIGALVYGKTQSSPILKALSDEIAADLCARLNFSDIAGFGKDLDVMPVMNLNSPHPIGWVKTSG